MKELLLKFLLESLTEQGEEKLEAVLQKLHDSDPTSYKAAVFGGWSLVTGLGPLVSKTGTKIDDLILNGLRDAIVDSANKNGISLPS